ncbi:pilus assembly protein PilM [bacterium]|nr:pilus assembly protein PilM [bacterium]
MKYKTAIDVGSSYIKVIEGNEKNGKLSIRKIFSCPNPITNIREDLVERDQDSFVKSLKTSLKKNGVKAKHCISSISGTNTIIHYFDIPNLPLSEIRPALNLEIMQVTPGGTNNLEYDYLLIPRKDKSNTVLFVGYPKKKSEFYVTTLQRVGLKPLVVDHDSFAILNSFKYLHKEDLPDPLFILNCGCKKTNLAIAENNGFILVRDIPFGASHITKIIAEKKGFELDFAEIYKTKEENIEDIKSIIMEDLEELLSEVVTGIEFFKARTKKTPKELFLTGGGVKMPGIVGMFQQSLQIDARIWNPIEELSPKIPFPEDIIKDGTSFSVVLGLILRKLQ